MATPSGSHDDDPTRAPEAHVFSRRQWGHTFERHGQDATHFLMKRARSLGWPQGQFLDNRLAADLILRYKRNVAGAYDLELPADFPARLINADGSFSSASGIRIVEGRKGRVRTAYPTA